jgi:hypothetical protein
MAALLAADATPTSLTLSALGTDLDVGEDPPHTVGRRNDGKELNGLVRMRLGESVKK